MSQRVDLPSAASSIQGRLIARLDGARVLLATSFEGKKSQQARCLAKLMGPAGKRVLPLESEAVVKRLGELKLGLKRCHIAPSIPPPPYVTDPTIGGKVIHPESTSEGTLIISAPAVTPVRDLDRLIVHAFYAEFNAVSYMVRTPKGRSSHGLLWDRLRCMGGLLPECRSDQEPLSCYELQVHLGPGGSQRLEERVSSDSCKKPPPTSRPLTREERAERAERRRERLEKQVARIGRLLGKSSPSTRDRGTASSVTSEERTAAPPHLRSFEALKRHRRQRERRLPPCREAAIFATYSVKQPMPWQRIVSVADRAQDLGHRYFHCYNIDL